VPGLKSLVEIGLVSFVIGGLCIEPQFHDSRLLRLFGDFSQQGSKDPLASRSWPDIHTLDPPDLPVTPI